MNARKRGRTTLREAVKTETARRENNRTSRTKSGRAVCRGTEAREQQQTRHGNTAQNRTGNPGAANGVDPEAHGNDKSWKKIRYSA